MTVSATPRTAGAHRVRLAVTLTYEMQCGYPGPGPIVVTFPSSMRLPRHFPTGSVKLNTKTTPATIKGHKVTVTVPPHKGVLCGTIGPGLVKLVFTHAAKVANPARSGSYGFAATHLKHKFTAQLKIS